MSEQDQEDDQTSGQTTDWLAITESYRVQRTPEQEAEETRRVYEAQAQWAAQYTRTLLAVTRTLSAQEQALILRGVADRSVGLQGIQVADWLEMAENRDVFLPEQEMTWQRWGEALAAHHDGHSGVRTIIGLATIAAATMYPDERERMVQQAERIALDTLESLGL